MSSDELGNVGGGRGGGSRGWLLKEGIRKGLKRHPIDLSRGLARPAQNFVEVINGASAQKMTLEVEKTSLRGC